MLNDCSQNGGDTANPKLNEPGAVEQGERAKAGRRGSSGAQSPPAGDRPPSPTGRLLASNPSGSPLE